MKTMCAGAFAAMPRTAIWPRSALALASMRTDRAHCVTADASAKWRSRARCGSGSIVTREPMKSRVIRVPDKLWNAARKRADERDETVSEAVRKFLERYTR